MDMLGCGWHKLLQRRTLSGLVGLLLIGLMSGCYAPLHYYGIPACELDDSYRTPTRAFAARMNWAHLTKPPTAEYVLGPGDLLELTVQNLFVQGDMTPFPARVESNGEIQLPMVGGLKVAGLGLPQAQEAITKAYADGFLRDPHVIVRLSEKATVDVVVVGEVNEPGVYALPADENDVAHAVASARGLTEAAAEIIQVHRRKGLGPRGLPMAPPMPPAPDAGPIQLQGGINIGDASNKLVGAKVRIASGFEPHKDVLIFQEQNGISGDYDAQTGVLTLNGTATADEYQTALQSVSYENRSEDLFDAARTVTFHVEVIKQPYEDDPNAVGQAQVAGGEGGSVLNIQLRAHKPAYALGPEDVVLQPDDKFTEEDITLTDGDVVYIQRRVEEMFWVVGELNDESQTRFSVRDRDRELGNGFFLPRDRDLDVVTAVAMAGYIDPIESPTTVTVQRQRMNQAPMLIVVDLIKARYNPQENIFVQPGDIIYLNPDAHWWFRRTLDRVIPSLITIPYDAFIARTILNAGQ